MRKYFFLLFLLFIAARLFAHPMPNSVVKLSVLEQTIKGEANMPLSELESAIGRPVININDPFFTQYFTRHIKAISNGKNWSTTIQSMTITASQDSAVGKYMELTVHFILTPPKVNNLRQFAFNYDAILHQVITHKALIFIEQDWDNGIQGESGARQIGIIELDIPTEKIYPLQVNLEHGSKWTGFISMIKLGARHISEGTDHLLFLLVLLLPAMLLPLKKQWGQFGGIKYSIINLLKIVTAFTIGHSVTLLLGALSLVKVPGQPVEILIAGSILVSAAHAIYPLFPRREIFVAAGFGLIHGLAFATVLANLDLSINTLFLSILGFNLGIELMQLFIIIMIVPWLILLSTTLLYKWVRISLAILAAMAAFGWIIERVSGESNFITLILEKGIPHAIWLIALIAVISWLAWFVERNNRANAIS